MPALRLRLPRLMAALLLPGAACLIAQTTPAPSPAASPAQMANNPTDLVPLQAGSHGFVKVDPVTHRLVFADGTPARFFGVNFAQYLNEPDRKITTEEMTKSLDDLRAMGVNLIRFQTYDGRMQQGVFGKGINAVALENRDRFFAEAKKRGIYMYMSMNTSDMNSKGGAAEIYKPMGGSKQSMIMIDQFIKDQQTYAVNLLDHVNPYTGLAYKDEPAIVSLQLGNEQHAYSRSTWGGTWTNFKGAMADELRAKWNKFLVDKYGSRQKLADAWGAGLVAAEDPTKGTVAITNAIYPDWKNPFTPTPRQRDAVLFGDYMEDHFLKAMRETIRNQAGDKNHLISDNGWVRGDNPIRRTARKDLDIMDVQAYWPHLDRGRLPVEKHVSLSPIKGCGLEILNSQLTAREIDGIKGPGVVTEYNSHKDNDRIFQLVPVHSVMAQLTGLDGVALWTYSDGSPTYLFNKDHWFSINRDQADLVRELMPFVVGAYLWNSGIPELIDHDAVMHLGVWDNNSRDTLSVDYGASAKLATSVKPYRNPQEGIEINFPGDWMLVNRPNAIFYTGKGPIQTAQFDYHPINNDTPYFIAAFPIDTKNLADAGEWRVFVTLDGTMNLKRSDFTKWRGSSRGYTFWNGDFPTGKLDSTKWEIKRPANVMYFDLMTAAFTKSIKGSVKGDGGDN